MFNRLVEGGSRGQHDGRFSGDEGEGPAGAVGFGADDTRFFAVGLALEPDDQVLAGQRLAEKERLPEVQAAGP